MRRTVIQHLVVDFVGIHNQLVFPGNFQNPLQQIIRIQSAGRIVRVDDDDCARARCDLGADVVQVGQPAGALVADIVARLAARQAHCRRPQRVIGRRHQHLVATVQQRLHRHHDQLGYAVANDDVIDPHPGNALALGLVHDCLACRKQAFRICVARSVRQVDDHVLHNFLGRIKAKRRRIADVQLDDALALFLHLLGARHHRATNVIANVIELGRFVDRA